MSANLAPSVRDTRHLRGIRRGDLESLEAIYLMYHKRVFSFLYRLCWSGPEAAALTEDTFEVLWKAALVVDTKLPLDLTLYRIARNVFLDEERDRDLAAPAGVSGSFEGVRATDDLGVGASRSELRASARLRAAGGEVGSEGESDADSHRVQHGSLGHKQEQALAEALFSLEPDSQTIFVLLVYQGLTIAQVSAVLSLPESQVMEIACSAEADLRVALAPMIRTAGAAEGLGSLDDDPKRKGRSRRKKKTEP